MKRLLGLLGWLGVVLVLAAVVIRVTKPELQPWSQGFALAGLVTTALYALSQWRDIGRSFQGRNVKYGSVAIGSVLLFLAILVAVNWIGSREHKRWDFTQNQQFTMSDQTKKILAGLSKPVSVHVFYDRQSGSAADYKDKFDEYRNLSRNITVEYVDAINDPVQSKKYTITALPTIVFESDGRTERTNSTDEQGITNALKKLFTGATKKIYFVQGHGEHGTDDTSGKLGYGGLAGSLKNDNFEVAKVTIAQEGKVPDDASVVVVGGPKIDYLPAEIDLLRGYLRRGGKLLLLIDPPDKPDAPPLTNLVAFAREFDIEIGNNVVVDASGLGQLFGANEAIPIAMPSNPPHAITRDLGQMMAAFPLTRSVTPIEGGVNGKTAQKLLETSPRSWAETDLKALFTTGKASPDPAQGDKTGPISIAAAVSFPADATSAAPGAKAEARLVVVGDSDFVANQALNLAGNRDLGLNMDNWLAQQEDLIAIRPREAADRRITLTQDQSNWMFWTAIFIIPGLLFVNAFRVWWKRR
ncbi:MAG TPA: Gldg family protein [Vicinamibacterales bacterium]|nr:Gldg family protein [Vicinamibacterales bacterium]